MPAVAVNGLVLSGFSQDLVFNHQIDPQESDRIASLFRSLYFELSFAEMARLLEKAKNIPWFPIAQVISRFHWQANDQFVQIAKALLNTPESFQKWCADKKVGPQDLVPLLSVGSFEMNFLYTDILHFQLSKSTGVKALEMGIELLLMGRKPEDLSSAKLVSIVPKGQSPGEAWYEALRQLRYPETFKRDQMEAEKWSSLPWPGSSQAKWVRQGDRGGIELKLFVTQPSDLKKYLQSLSKVQDLIEKETSPEMKH